VTPSSPQEPALELLELANGPLSTPVGVVAALAEALKRKSLADAQALCSSEGWRHSE